jgi:hypothetical protein
MNENVYIYGLFDPIKKETFYVGKTINNLKLRLRNHITEKGTNTEKDRIISNIISKGKRPLIWKLCDCSVDEWEIVETEMIRFIRDEIGCELTNVAKGGEDGTSDCKCKPINQYDLNGKYITTYKSLAEAGRVLTNSIDDVGRCATEAIGRCARDKHISAYGYIWIYVGDEDKLNDKVLRLNSPKIYKHSDYMINKLNEKKKLNEQIRMVKRITRQEQLEKQKEITKQNQLEYRRKYRQTEQGRMYRREQKKRAMERKRQLIVDSMTPGNNSNINKHHLKVTD